MQFDVRALNSTGSMVSLQMEALNEADAAQQVKNQGYGVISIKTKRARSGAVLRRGARFPLVLFSRELLALLKAGLSVVEAMQAFAEKERGSAKNVAGHIVECIYKGLTLSQSLQQQPSAFPMLYVAMIRASERTGNIAEALARYITYRSQVDAVRKKVVSASLYPLLLMVAGGMVSLFLVVYVVPKFSHVYEDLGQDMPLLSRWLMELGHLLESHGSTVLLAVSAIFLVMSYGFVRPEFRQWVGHQLWRLPAIGERMRVYQLAQFYRSLGMLLQSGVPLVTALDMASGLLSPALNTHLTLAIGDIREGQPLSRTMEARGLSTPVALRLLQVGERSGQMGEMLDHVANFYDEELALWVDWFTKLFEPMLMAFIGLVIGTIVVLMYMPVFELAGSLQ